MENFYDIIKQGGLNGDTAVCGGSILALSYIEKTEKEYIDDLHSALRSIEQYCKEYEISDDVKNDFLVEVNEYSLK